VKEDTPIACSLEADALSARLEAMAQLGAKSLTSREADGERWQLRFRADPSTRRQLARIVAAEAECCPFLELSLSEVDDLLLLSIAAPGYGREVADQLAAAFSRSTERH
jgi:hypothetical protein